MTTTELKSLPEKDLLKPSEVANFFQVSIKTVYNWHDQGLIMGINPTGGSLRISRGSIIQFLKSTNK